jgi:hypothetical protein
MTGYLFYYFITAVVVACVGWIEERFCRTTDIEPADVITAEGIPPVAR